MASGIANPRATGNGRFPDAVFCNRAGRPSRVHARGKRALSTTRGTAAQPSLS
jgi:hypothetical protein